MQRELPEHGQLVLGRGDECDIVILHPSVSRRHARLHLGYPLRIEDLGSANGTRAHGRKLATGEVVVVDSQASLQLGDVTLLVRPSARESLLPPSPASERRTGLLASELAKVERARIVEALERCAGNQSRAAKELGISRRTLVGKLTEHALPRVR